MYDTLLTIHFVAMAAAVGMGIFVPVLAAVTARTAPDSVPAVMGPVGRAASYTGITSVTLLWISGAWMAYGYGRAAGRRPQLRHQVGDGRGAHRDRVL